MRTVATTFARFIALTVFLFAFWVFANVLRDALTGVAYDQLWTPWLILGVAVVGLVGSVVFLLSFDGPRRWHTRGRRFFGWCGMMFFALLPTQLIMVMVPLTALGLLALLIPPTSGVARGRHLITSR